MQILRWLPLCPVEGRIPGLGVGMTHDNDPRKQFTSHINSAKERGHYVASGLTLGLHSGTE